jgi:hypothetical protein
MSLRDLPSSVAKTNALNAAAVQNAALLVRPSH